MLGFPDGAGSAQPTKPWHQLGGRRRHLLFRAQREVMIARGMLTGAALRG
jgi:hypothetical protein